MALHNTKGSLNIVKCKRRHQCVFSQALDDGDVASLCQISGVRISGRQFFPCEEVGQTQQMFDVTFGVTVVMTKFVSIYRYIIVVNHSNTDYPNVYSVVCRFCSNNETYFQYKTL